MPTIDFTQFSENTIPLSSDYLVGIRQGGVEFNEYKTTFDSVYQYVNTQISSISGNYVIQDNFGNATITGALNADSLNTNNQIQAGSNITTTNGSLVAQGASNSLSLYDRAGSGSYASLYKQGGSTFLGDSTIGTTITYTSAGYVGIGTVVPSYTMEVTGSGCGFKHSFYGAPGNIGNSIYLFQGHGRGLNLANNIYQNQQGINIATYPTGALFNITPSGSMNFFQFNNATAGQTASLSAVATITSSAQVGIGTTTPNQTLTVNGSISASSNIYSSGNVGIGTSTPNKPLTVVGDVSATGNLYANNVGGPSIKAMVNFRGLSVTAFTGVSFLLNTVARVTTVVATKTSHGLLAGDTITIASSTTTSLIGNWILTAATANTFTFIITTANTYNNVTTTSGSVAINGICIRSQYNVQSVTRTSTGLYTITFATPLANSLYVITGSGSTLVTGSTTSGNNITNYPVYTQTTTSCTVGVTNTTGSFTDAPVVSVAIIGI